MQSQRKMKVMVQASNDKHGKSYIVSSNQFVLCCETLAEVGVELEDLVKENPDTDIIVEIRS